uniref:Signal peptidase complex subunit 2 n=1 Tax=Mucochytrium quahogii TaxID=96639 RepID=A0A7S2SDS5_9STRA|mmetsp:Transcript_13945/g.24680  ORF Transcript_13945/g.24680 Transcript_13945/m.24680 type:complete len:190 (+) Transcript_13945:132-701(+)
MSDDEHDPDAIPPVDVLDQVAVKRTLDDCLTKIVDLGGYPVDYTLGNIKLLIMFAACGVAAYAQLGPHSFPENKLLLGCCVGFYTFCCFILQLLSTFVEKDIVVRTHDKKGVKGSAIMISTKLKRGEHMLTLTCHFRNNARDEKESFCKSVGTYFSEKGEIDEIALQKDVQSLIFKLENTLQNGTKKDK